MKARLIFKRAVTVQYSYDDYGAEIECKTVVLDLPISNERKEHHAHGDWQVVGYEEVKKDKVEKLQDKIEYEQSINDQKQREINLKYREIIELQEQIDKMKCCANCENYCQRIDNRCNTECKNHSLWKLNEDFEWRAESN